MWTVLLWAALMSLVLIAGVLLRRRLRERLSREETPPVDDEAVRTILETGTLTADSSDPLDLREIEEEERRFWAEDWEEPEPW